jgi:hypothetical protein
MAHDSINNKMGFYLKYSKYGAFTLHTIGLTFYGLFYDSVSFYTRIFGCLVSDKLERIWKEAVVLEV